MIQINFEKILEDIGITKTLKEVLKKNTSLSDEKIENFIKERITQHGEKMNSSLFVISNYIDERQQKDIKDDNMKNIDKDLDAMIKGIQDNYKIFEKKMS